MTTVSVSLAQQKAIDEQAAVYGSDPTICRGLDHYTIHAASDWAEADAYQYPPSAVSVNFHYVPADRDPDLLGLEVTIFAADGSVLDSQDFG